MDGNTAIVTIGADIAASKGILVVNSAGNEGNSSWKYIAAPADGDSVFSIGAVDAGGQYASFSSKGPTFDGRIKPDVVAQGKGTKVISTSTGNVISGNGTPLSSPVIPGMTSCLWQAFPNKAIADVMDAVKLSASPASSHDTLMGHGIPDFFQAYNILSAPVIHSIKLNVKAMLEGPFDGAQMAKHPGYLLPLAQPFSTPPYNYSGNEIIETANIPEIIDWLLIELRDAPDITGAIATNSVWRQAVLIKNNGMIVDTGTMNPVELNLTIADSLYLIIRHLNHLDVISSSALVDDGTGNWVYDFTTGVNTAYGGSAGHKTLTPGISGMAAGDGDASMTIDENDLTAIWKLQSGKTGYLTGDYNLDGQINNPDKNEKYLENIGKIGPVNYNK
jgi:hypothetical protein